MKVGAMANFVLVHGAWHGGWCWTPLERELRALGHETSAPTLTGLGERSHLATPQVTPDTHVLDIVNHIKWQGLEDVILVGHSYGGVIITGVAGRMPERLRTLVYLDAIVPEQSGVSAVADRNPERTAAFREQLANGGFMVDPDRFDSWTDDAGHMAWLREKCTPHPIRCLIEGVTLTGREAEVDECHYILATLNKPSLFWEESDRAKGRAGWQLHERTTKHDVMVEAPSELAEKLHAIAGPPV